MSVCSRRGGHVPPKTRYPYRTSTIKDDQACLGGSPPSPWRQWSSGHVRGACVAAMTSQAGARAPARMIPRSEGGTGRLTHGLLGSRTGRLPSPYPVSHRGAVRRKQTEVEPVHMRGKSGMRVVCRRVGCAHLDTGRLAPQGVAPLVARAQIPSVADMAVRLG
jgi:hypothetical protein